MKERKSMQEIHEIMEELYNKRKKMNRKEVVEDIHAGAKELTRRYGLKIEKASSKVTVRKQPMFHPYYYPSTSCFLCSFFKMHNRKALNR